MCDRSAWFGMRSFKKSHNTPQANYIYSFDPNCLMPYWVYCRSQECIVLSGTFCLVIVTYVFPLLIPPLQQICNQTRWQAYLAIKQKLLGGFYQATMAPNDHVFTWPANAQNCYGNPAFAESPEWYLLTHVAIKSWWQPCLRGIAMELNEHAA